MIKKKILIVGNYNSIHLQNWIKHFITNINFSTSYLSYEKSNFKFNDSVIQNLSRSDNRFYSIISNFFFVLKFIRIEKPQIIVIHYINEQLTIFSILKYFFRYKLVIVPWGSDLNFNINLIQKLIKKILITNSDMIITDGYHIKEKINNFFKVHHNNIIISNFGINLQHIYDLSENLYIDEFIHKNKIKKFIVSNRSLEDLYSIDTLIYAFDSFVKNNIDFSLIIIGDGAKKNELSKIAKKLNIQKKIFFLGRLQHQDLLRWVKKSKIYVSTSLYDAGLSSSIAEAVFLKKRVICANNSDNNFWMEKYKKGLIFKGRDFNDLNHKLSKILELKDEDNIDISYFKKMFDYDSVMKNIEFQFIKFF